MSRYLERIIAHAKAPATAIRPLVRPLYAPPAKERSSGPLADAIVAALRASETGVEKTPFSAAVPPGQPGETLATPSRRASAPPRDRDEDFPRARHFTALMPVADEAADQSTSGFPNRSKGGAHDGSNDGRAIPLQTAGEAIRESASMREQRTQPLMPRQPRANPSMSGPFAAAPADEIQIHIGRIEITAVPPASAPRPAVRTSPRGVSLDEYLQRGNERAR